ncbi:TIGR00341 family protein [Haloarchaeobius amylolyticus]|uniref:TIGR00341 family protein n=1 Tax=Haloarchaeobius amylolyticus TaxID=1198296 RepID=UPI0022709E79|nr:TIGR00341 family protein [Haloarchaeobius amylolyticus]
MRLVQALIPEGKRDSVLTVLEREGIDYALFEETGRGDFEAMVQFPVPTNGLEPVLKKLRIAGIRDDSYTIVLPVELVISRRFEALREKYAGLRVSREELSSRAYDLAPVDETFFPMLFLSTLIAATGLLQNSAATIIGAMVVAPLMGPAIAASVGAVLEDAELGSRGLFLQVTGLVGAIALGFLVGVVVQQTVLVEPDLAIRDVPQIMERVRPGILSLVLALGSGAAGAISIMRGSGSTLVGVAIAVALVPPAATAGIALAYGEPLLALGGTALVVVNLLAINLSALVLFWVAGYRPEHRLEAERARAAVRMRTAKLVVAIAVLTVLLGVVTVTTHEVQSLEKSMIADLEETFDAGEYGRMAYLDSDVEYLPVDHFLGKPVRARVILGYHVDTTPPPGLAHELADRLEAKYGREFRLEVVYVAGERSWVDPGTPGPSGETTPSSLA